MSNIVEIVSKICDYENKGDALIKVLSVVFDESNEVKLLKKRALFMEECDRVLKDVGEDEDSFDDIYKVLSHTNLTHAFRDIKPVLGKVHKRHVRMAFSFYENIQRPHEVDEILEASDDLKEDIESEDLTEPQKAIIYEVCEAVENAHKEQELIGSSAVKKLLELLIGKMYLYKDEIQSIQSEKIKEKLIKVCSKVEEANKIMGFVISLKNNVSGFIGLFN